MVVYDTASMNVKRSLSPKIVATVLLCPSPCQHRSPKAEEEEVLGGAPAVALVCEPVTQHADLYERSYQSVRLIVKDFHSLAARS